MRMLKNINRRQAILALGLTGLGAAGGLSPALADEATVETARKEGALLWYDQFGQREAEQILAAFRKDYPFIKDTVYVEVPAAQKPARVMQECMAGGPTSDILLYSAAALQQFVDQGFVHETDWKSLGMDVSATNTPNPHMALVLSALFVVVYNTKTVKEDEVPKTWEDLIDSRWKGRTGAWSRAIPFVELSSAWGEQKTRDYVKLIAALTPRLFTGTFPLAQAAAAGEVDIGVGTYDAIQRVMGQGAPIAVKLLSPVPIGSLYGCVIKQGKNPNAGKLFLSWLTSPTGALTFERITHRGNFRVAETKTAQLVKGTEVTFRTAQQEIENVKQLTTLEADLSKMLQGR
jgi:iron(III) transport system substrate-binding protein